MSEFFRTKSIFFDREKHSRIFNYLIHSVSIIDKKSGTPDLINSLVF